MFTELIYSDILLYLFNFFSVISKFTLLLVHVCPIKTRMSALTLHMNLNSKHRSENSIVVLCKANVY
jgi:hypothetical protein